MADTDVSQHQLHESPPSPAPSSPSSTPSSSSSRHDADSHDWVARQLKTYRPKFVEQLDITVKIVSWNVNGKRILADLTQLLLEPAEPGLVAIGLQEMDLGKSAYVVYDPTYETEWTAAVASVLGDHYEKVASHQLIGIFLMVFANKALVPAISAVEKSHLATGHFSILGNKGGVGLRLQCYDSTICFVDVHLYHTVEGLVKRTEDFRRIIKELVFEDAPGIKTHDHVFFFGDLNYRLDASTEEVKQMLENGGVGELLQRDQLLQSMPIHKTFRGFQEAPIAFPPTYKYDLGTSIFDTSEKQRCPSWTDRILWKSCLPVQPLHYSSFPSYVMSDHKPISADFNVTLETIIPERYNEIHTMVLRELDRLENEARPTLEISNDHLTFDKIAYLEPQTHSITLKNTGHGMAHFEFQDLRTNADLNQKDFIFLRPQKGSLGPAEQIAIDVTILVDDRTIPAVCTGRPLDEIIVLEIRNGRHIFLSLQGTFQPTCFGMPLEYLASFGSQSVRDTAARRRSGGGMPEELWRMTEFILVHGQAVGTVFLERGDETVCRRVRECLDTARAFDGVEGETGVLSVGETLMRFLEALPGGIVSAEAYDKVVRMGEAKVSMMEVMDVIPGTHANVLIYLLSFIRQIFEWPVLIQNPEAKRRIVRAFAKALIRTPVRGGSQDIRRREVLLSRLLDE